MTNYSVNKPSYAFSSATTEFDEALIKHGVINRTQALVAKGATVQEAERLLQEEQEKRAIASKTPLRNWYDDDKKKSCNNDDDDDDSYDDLLDDDDDEILRRYRQLRLDELKSARGGQDKSRGIVESISCDEWMAKVNDASRDGTPVVICLTTSSARHEFLDACAVLAQRHRSNAIFVTLPSKEALPDWPHSEPSVLVYRHGKLWREFFRLTALSVDDLETTLCDIWAEQD